MLKSQSQSTLNLIIGIGAMAIFIYALFFTQHRFDPMAQRNFPCAEDEYLGFSTTHHDQLECIHIDTIKADLYYARP